MPNAPGDESIHQSPEVSGGDGRTYDVEVRTRDGLLKAGQPLALATFQNKPLIEPIRDRLFLVTWQEADKTTVVHLEDYKQNTIITNVTEPDGKFSNFHGQMKLIS